MKIKLILILLGFFLLLSPAYSETSEPKNKPLAILLSLVSPGIGQIYEGRLLNGLAMWSATSILSMSFFMVIGDIDLSSQWVPTVRFRLKPHLTTEDYFWAAGFGITYLFFYIYNVLDVALYRDPPLTAFEMDNDGFRLSVGLRF